MWVRQPEPKEARLTLSRRLSPILLLSAAAAVPTLARAAAEPAVGTAAPTTTAAPAAATVPPTTATAGDAKQAEAGDGLDAVLPKVDFNNVPVEDVVQFLQDVDGKFRAVVVRKGVRTGPPVTMKLQNVTVRQILDVLTTAYEGVELHPVDGPTGPIFVVTLRPPNPGGEPGVAGPADGGQGVRVYRLAGIIEAMLNGGGWEPKGDRPNRDGQRPPPLAAGDRAKYTTAAMNDVLSLIKATLQLTDAGEAPTLQVHEETQTLIFRGTPAQQAAVEDVMLAMESNRAIRPAEDRAAAPLRAAAARSKEEADRLRAEADQARSAVEKVRDESMAARMNLESALKGREVEKRAAETELERARAQLAAAELQLKDAKATVATSQAESKQAFALSQEAQDKIRQADADAYWSGELVRYWWDLQRRPAPTGDATTDGIRARRWAEDMDQRFRRLEDNLASIGQPNQGQGSQLGPNHPKVVQLDEVLTALREARAKSDAAAQAAAKAGAARSPAVPTTRPGGQ
jgi:hypothetical protein